MEICAAELESKSFKLIILSLCRVSTGYCIQVMKNLDDTLKHMCKPKVEFLIFGDIITDYVIESKR